MSAAGLQAESLFELGASRLGPLLRQAVYPWEILSRLGEIILRLGSELPAGFRELSEGVWVGSDTVIADSARIGAPALIGRGCEIRHGAFFRGRVILGDGVVVGNATELKNCLLFDEVMAPHFNYVGDSILGRAVRLGAGAVLSNTRLDRAPVRVTLPGGMTLDSGLVKLGAMLGDGVEVGCNAVLGPGTIVGRGAVIYPLASARGYVPPGVILKADGRQVPRLSSCRARRGSRG